MGKFKEREKISLSDIALGINQKKFDTPISKELLEANDWCSCSYTLDDQDPYNVIMGWCPDPDIYNIEDLDVTKFFVYQNDENDYIYMYDDVVFNTIVSAADLEIAIAATCAKYEYDIDCPLCTMDNLFSDTHLHRYLSKLDLGNIFNEMKINKNAVIGILNNKLNDAEKEMSRMAVAGVEDKDLEEEIQTLKEAISYIEKFI